MGCCFSPVVKSSMAVRVGGGGVGRATPEMTGSKDDDWDVSGFRFGLLLKEVYLKLYRNTLDGLNEVEEELWGHKYQPLLVVPTSWKQEFNRSLKCSLHTPFLKESSSSSSPS